MERIARKAAADYFADISPILHAMPDTDYAASMPRYLSLDFLMPPLIRFALSPCFDAAQLSAL